ncbi:MAG: hypothetical protein K8F58_15335 [Bauldia sp.]|nr:hypothetical protein [Bauldia sp.]
MERHVIFHYHLFKNAGTSLDVVLKRNFPGGWATKEFEGIEPLENHRMVAEWVKAEPEMTAFSSHTAMGPVPAIPGTRIHPVIFMRNAFDRLRSAYSFEKKQDSRSFGAVLAKQVDFDGYVRGRLDNPGDRFCRNFHCARLASFVRDTEASELECALLALERIDLVGVVEQFDVSLAVLERQLESAFPQFKVMAAHANRGAETERPLDERVERMRAELKTRNVGIPRRIEPGRLRALRSGGEEAASPVRRLGGEAIGDITGLPLQPG